MWKRFKEISAHEASHVAFLEKALGDKAVKACEYNFGDISKPATFVATSILLEGVGVSAYLGAANKITNPVSSRWMFDELRELLRPCRRCLRAQRVPST